MKQSTRIIANALAIYGRSVFSLVVTLFSARWVLEALGEIDFGLYGVVGSLILLITFVNGGMVTGVSRFYAYSIGLGHGLSSREANDDLKRWFNTAFSIHMILPVLVVFFGYPLGAYAIENWLTIPPERMDACLWVFRISLATAFVSVFSIPFIAMYTAHQLITELAFFDIFRSCCTFAGAYYLLGVESDRLVVYALYMMAINVIVPLLQILRAIVKFKACSLHIPYMLDFKCFKELLGFVGWKTFGMSCLAMRLQGSPILINLVFGPQINAAYNIANRVSIQATMISTALMGAFQPAITSMEGRGERKMVLETSLQVCKFGTLLVLFFTTPLILEINYVLRIWLKNPPAYTGILCQWLLAMLVVDRLTAGHMLAVNAKGKIALYELVQGTLLALALPMGWFLFKNGVGPVGMGYALFCSMTAYCIGRLFFARQLLQMPIKSWVQQVAVPVGIVIFFSSIAGYGILKIQEEGFIRLLVTTFTTGLISLILGWFLVLQTHERIFVKDMIKKVMKRLLGRWISVS
jgi:O-antigen/teichoic acid export membrane protein